ncbi:unnamed protein product [Chondrus crispus]|uniref:Uncharacterized protein n=1 Tax=Chondrus crispus TaxID=2769 RepID=R7QFJ1_CHOCR|nr:unnamed protein product [Chondrus crispus]CDF36190.1 unnamed protein product [Chondrus crispus]|eukprot:XP_005716009.1 unnamed protein product [Chondrus crispus]
MIRVLWHLKRSLEAILLRVLLRGCSTHLMTSIANGVAPLRLFLEWAMNAFYHYIARVLLTFLFHLQKYLFNKMFPCMMAEFISRQVCCPYVIFNPSDICQLF